MWVRRESLDRSARGRKNADGGAADPSVLTTTTRDHGRTTRRALAVLALVAVVVCLGAVPHDHAAGDAHPHTALALAGLGTLLAAGSALAIAARRRGRELTVAVLALALTLFAFETALHSVHHLGERAAERSCAVAGATTHLSGAGVPSADLGPVVPDVERAIDRTPAWRTPLPPIRPREGRAPPVPTSA